MNFDQIPVTIYGLTMQQILLLKEFYEKATGTGAQYIGHPGAWRHEVAVTLHASQAKPGTPQESGE